VKLLLDNNVNFYDKNKDGFNIFHIIAQNDNLNILKMIADEFKKNTSILLTYNVTPHGHVNAYGGEHRQTPLHLIAKTSSTLMAEYLINELKANKEVRDYKYRTPLAIAAEYSKIKNHSNKNSDQEFDVI
jgi:ankyrin repeat protein